MPTSDDFRAELETQLARADSRQMAYVDIISGELHRAVGDYPGQDTHRMPSCCTVMRAAMRATDQIIHAPPSGQGATLKIRYHLPR